MIVETAPELDDGPDGDQTAKQAQLLQAVFALVKTRTGRDFSRYKQSTVLRRIGRRMQIEQIEKLETYVDLLRRSSNETETLAEEFLITVTEFFRDPEIYSTLAEELIPTLFEGKGPNDVIRVWSVGCSTGEEAYSIAMLLVEERSKHASAPLIQVFASDLHEHSLKRARAGSYPETIAENISDERLLRFFTREDGVYTVKPELRDIVLFTPHNLLADAPFSRLDMITCRNVLIYLQRNAQSDAMDVFHYALNPGGLLLLGTSETVERSEYFRLEHKEYNVYRKLDVAPAQKRLPVFTFVPSRKSRQETVTASDPPSSGATHEAMVERFAPPSILLDADDKVAHVSRSAGRYLRHPGGTPSTSVLKLIREELSAELANSLHSARQTGEPVRTRPISLTLDGITKEVTLDVRPGDDADFPGLLLLIFEERPVSSPTGEAREPLGEERAVELESELASARLRLRTLMEEFNATREEMSASNEELQSMNEELRSALEELETSKEELQSVNEELVTLNQENRHRVEELSQLSADLQNLLSSTEIATVFLDRELRILRFTPGAGELFSVRGNDRGRPLADLTNQLAYDDLLADARQVLETLERMEREVESVDGRWFLLRMLPYRSADDRIEGVVINFVDISDRRRAEQDVRALNLMLEQIVEDRTEKLKLSNDELVAFNYSVSHDLRAPLRGIDGFAQVLLEEYGDKLDETGQGYLKRVRAGANRIGELIDDLLELSRITGGSMHRGSVDLASAARQIAKVLNETNGDDHVEFSVAEELVANGDEGLLRIALENLLGNAWTFTREQPAAHVEFGSERRGEQTVYFVRDDGVGFDMRYADKLFTPFQRLHPNDSFPGSGIGLSLVHRIVTRHGGTLWAEGKPGEGSTFYFTLPSPRQGVGPAPAV